MEKTPEVAIAVLNYNGLSQTRDCLKAVLKTKYPKFKVIMADNGSAENEAEILKKEFQGVTKFLPRRHPEFISGSDGMLKQVQHDNKRTTSNTRLKFVRFPKNLGFSKGQNEIIRRFVQTEHIFILDNDVTVDPDCLGELVKVIISDAKIAAVAAKVRSFYQPEYFDPSGAGGFIDKLGFPYTRGRIGFYVEKDEGQYDEVRDIFWGAGGCLLLKKKAWEEVGFLPESFFYYHEETDFCFRLKNHGWRIVSVPKAQVYHKGRGVSAKNLVKRLFFIHRNGLFLLVRNLSFRRMAWVLPLRFVLDGAIGLYYLLTFKLNFFFGLVAAYISFCLSLPGLFRKRLSERKMAREAEKEMKPLSIFGEYFIHRVRRYSELEGKYTKIPIRKNYYLK